MEHDSTTRMRVAVNPHAVRGVPLSFFGMAKTTTTPLEAIVRDNVRRLLVKHFEGKPGQMSRLHENVTLSRLQDFLAGKGCLLASLQPWADAFGVKPYHLLIKDLDIDDLPEIVSAKRLRRLEKLRSELLEEER